MSQTLSGHQDFLGRVSLTPLQLCGLVQGQERHHIVPHSHSPVRGADPRVPPVLSAAGFSQGLCPCPPSSTWREAAAHTPFSIVLTQTALSRQPKAAQPTGLCSGRDHPASQAWLTAVPEPWHCLGPWGPSLSSQGYPTAPAEGCLWGKEDDKHLHSPCSRPACECWGCGSTCPKPTPHRPPAPSQHCCHPLILPALPSSCPAHAPFPPCSLAAGRCLPPSLVALSLGRHGPLSRGDSPGHALAQVLSLPCSSSCECSLCPGCRIPAPPGLQNPSGDGSWSLL